MTNSLLTYDDILLKYNINTSLDTLKSDQKDAFKDTLILKIKLLNEINIILSSNNSLVDKQKQLENLEEPFLKKSSQLKYNMPSILLEATHLLKQDLAVKQNSTDHDIRKLIEKSSDGRKFRALGTKKINFYQKYNEILKTIYKGDEDPSIILIFSFANAVRKLIDENSLIAKQTIELELKAYENINQKIKAYNEALKVLFSEDKLSLKRTNFIIKIANFFYHKYKIIFKSIEKKASFLEKENLEEIYLNQEEIIFLALQIECLLIKFNFITCDRNDKILINNTKDQSIFDMDNINLDDDDILDYSDDDIAENITKNNEKKRTRSPFTITINNEFALSLFEMNYFQSSLPMIVEPNDWNVVYEKNEKISYNSSTVKNTFQKKEIEKKRITFGGFLCNEKALFPGVHLKDETSYSYVPESVLKNLNYLQKTCFKINSTALQFVVLNFKKCLAEFLYDRDLDINEIIKEDHKKTLIILSFDDYLIQNNIILHNLTENASSSLIETKKKELQHYLQRHATFINSLIDFIFTIEIASIFENKKLFFKLFFDSRGRVYSNGYPISPQGNVLSKFLLDFYENSTELYTEKLQDYMNFKGADFYEKYHELINKNKSYKSLDASCSGISIISGLVGYKNGLLKTNVLKDKTTNQKEDYYALILSRMLESVNLIKNDSIKTILLNCFTRTFIKGWVMRYVYSEGTFSRMIELKRVYIIEKNKIFNNIKITEEEYHIINYYATEFPGFVCRQIVDFIEFLKKSVMEKKNTNKSCYLKLCSKQNLNSFFSIICVAKKEKAMMKWKRIKNIKNPITHNIENIVIESKFVYKKLTDKLDSQKLARCVVPHFIHHLDSLLLNYVISKCREQKISLFTAHDCFFVLPKHEQQIKDFYAEAFLTELLENDPIGCFLLENFETTEVLNNYSFTLFAFNRSKENILNELKENNDLQVKRDYILS